MFTGLIQEQGVSANRQTATQYQIKLAKLHENY